MSKDVIPFHVHLGGGETESGNCLFFTFIYFNVKNPYAWSCICSVGIQDFHLELLTSDHLKRIFQLFVTNDVIDVDHARLPERVKRALSTYKNELTNSVPEEEMTWKLETVHKSTEIICLVKNSP